MFVVVLAQVCVPLDSPRWNTSRLVCLVGIRPFVAMRARRMSDFAKFLLILVGLSARFFA